MHNEVLIELYNQGLSASQIASKFSVATSSVVRRLKKVGIKLRSSSDYEKEKRYWLWKGNNYLDPLTRKRNQLKHRKWSHAVIARDCFKCQHCSIPKGRLEAHHVVSLRECIDTNLEFDIANGVTLCKKCHANIHKTYKKG